jgi:hypothetical protein
LVRINTASAPLTQFTRVLLHQNQNWGIVFHAVIIKNTPLGYTVI